MVSVQNDLQHFLYSLEMCGFFSEKKFTQSILVSLIILSLFEIVTNEILATKKKYFWKFQLARIKSMTDNMDMLNLMHSINYKS